MLFGDPLADERKQKGGFVCMDLLFLYLACVDVMISPSDAKSDQNQ